MRDLIENCGVFWYPQLAVSALTLAVLLGYLVEWLRGGLRGPERPWTRTLEPLAGIAVSIGLLGSVTSVMQALQLDSRDMAGISQEIGVAYTTTAVGLVTSLFAMAGCWFLGILARKER